MDLLIINTEMESNQETLYYINTELGWLVSMGDINNPQLIYPTYVTPEDIINTISEELPEITITNITFIDDIDIKLGSIDDVLYNIIKSKID